MLSIASVSGSGWNYYTSLLEDYYRRNDLLAQWFGQGAKALGLEGAVGEKEFTNLLRGFSPDGTRPLVQNAGRKNRQLAHDLTFSAPKSVSVHWVVASPERREAIAASVFAAARDVLQPVEAGVCHTRRGHGGKSREPVKVVFALFLHGTSRALDPNLHVHVILFNVGLRRDGTTGAILTKPIFEQKMRLGQLFREKLAERLERDLGLPIERTEKGFRIHGVPEELCRAFSSRRKQIQDALKEKGLTGAVAAKVACLDTRAKKQDVRADLLFESWAATARSFRFGREAADRLFGQARELGSQKARAASAKPPAATEADLEVKLPTPATPGLGKIEAKPVVLPAPEPAQELTPIERQGLPKATPHNERVQNQSLSARIDKPGKGLFAALSLFKPLTFGPDAAARVNWPAKNRLTFRVRTTRPREKVVGPDPGRRLFRIPFTRLELLIVRDLVFRKAPFWSPFKKFALPKLVLGREGDRLDAKPRRFTVPLWEKTFGPLRLAIHRMRLFPWAPAWSPVARLDSTILALNFKARIPKPSPPRRPKLSELSRLRQRFAPLEARAPEHKQQHERTR